MPNSATPRSEVIERGVEAGLSILVRAGIILIVSLICFWVAEYAQEAAVARIVRMIGYSGLVITAIVAIYAVSRILMAKSTPTVEFSCPYCNTSLRFDAMPVTDFDCERCHRRVYFVNGKVAPIIDVICEGCKTLHKVSANVPSYICDVCNKKLRLPNEEVVQAVVVEREEVSMFYDVILKEVGRNPTEVAMALERIMNCNMLDAHEKMETLPLTVSTNVPERKAEMIRRRLCELGASAIARRCSADDYIPTNPT